MERKTSIFIALLFALFAVLFLFSYNTVTGLLASQLPQTNIEYDEQGHPIREVALFRDRTLEIVYTWEGAKLAGMAVQIIDRSGKVEEYLIDRTKDEWSAYLDGIEAKAKERTKLGKTVRRFLITTRLRS